MKCELGAIIKFLVAAWTEQITVRKYFMAKHVTFVSKNSSTNRATHPFLCCFWFCSARLLNFIHHCCHRRPEILVCLCGIHCDNLIDYVLQPNLIKQLRILIKFLLKLLGCST